MGEDHQRMYLPSPVTGEEKQQQAIRRSSAGISVHFSRFLNSPYNVQDKFIG